MFNLPHERHGKCTACRHGHPHKRFPTSEVLVVFDVGIKGYFSFFTMEKFLGTTVLVKM
jgi:hypothetical protein